MSLDIKNWKPVDYIIAFIAIVVGLFIILSLIGQVVFNQPMSEMKARLISSIVTSLVSVLSLYVGNRLKGGENNNKENKK